jgi:hypothetical protein
MFGNLSHTRGIYRLIDATLYCQFTTPAQLLACLYYFDPATKQALFNNIADELFEMFFEDELEMEVDLSC